MKEKELKAIKEIIYTLNKATLAYDSGNPIMSDKEWDELYFKLKNFEMESGIIYPDSPTQKISYEVVSNLEKVSHNHKMLSLDKTKNWNEFLNYFSIGKGVIGMLKMDGLTCSLKYLNGELVSAETRGNGTVGENILHNAKVISSIPKKINYMEELIVDGEIICTYQDFEEFSSEYKNPRNFAAGSIRLLDAKECSTRKLTFVVWNIVSGFGETNSFMSKLNNCMELGFTVVPWTSSFDWDAKEYLIDKAKELGYPIDGLVGRYDDILYGQSLGETDHHSRAAYAFKFYDETYPTMLVDVEWTMGRTGVLTPVAIFKPIEIDGAVVERASLHNLSVMEELFPEEWRTGYTAYVYKANMIIPQIDKLVAEENTNAKRILLPKVCPVCGEPVSIEFSDSGVKNLVCHNANCEGKLINKLDYFCGKKGLDIKGVSKATLEKLIEWEWVSTYSDIFNLKNYQKEWMNKAGFGPKSVINMLNSIETVAKKVELENFIAAIGIPLIGSVQAKEIVKRFKTWESLREAINNNFDFSVLDGFGESKTYALLKYDYTQADEVYKMLNVTHEDAEISNSNLSGLSICITGSLKLFKNRDALTKEIESHGGKVVSSVTKNTKYLINNDINSTSSKNVSANKLGIPILSEEEFKEKFL